MASISTSHPGSASAATPTRVLEKRRSRLADDGSLFRRVIHHICRDLHDVGVARADGGKGQADIAHRLSRLRSQIVGADQRAMFVDGDLTRRVDRAFSSGRDHLRECRIMHQSFRAGMLECVHSRNSLGVCAAMVTGSKDSVAFEACSLEPVAT